MSKGDKIYISFIQLIIILLITSVVDYSTHHLTWSKDNQKIMNSRKRQADKELHNNLTSRKDMYFALFFVSIKSSLVHTKHLYLMMISRKLLSKKEAFF